MTVANVSAAAAELARLPAHQSVARSLGLYYGDTARDQAMDELYQRFVPAGGLAFDIGSHVGDRTASFRRLGARVVAVEPQPACATVLYALFDADEGVQIVEQACAATPGEVTFHVNADNPTVSTASSDFIASAQGAEGWSSQRWTKALTIPATTLDALAVKHGAPDFIKIDVEGFEDQVLRGLSKAPPALSFEFTTIARNPAVRAIRQLQNLASFVFDVAYGESQQLEFGPGQERDAEAMIALITGLPHAVNSGDVYAIRV